MSETSRLKLVGAWALLLVPPLLVAENWPQWRGPQSQGVSPEEGLPVEWGVGKNLDWTASLAGSGVSSPVVWGDLVIVTSQTGRAHGAGRSFPLLARDDTTLAERENPIQGAVSASGEVYLVVEAFRRSDGRRLWEYRTKATGEFPALHEKHNLATPTPAVDGERIYALFGTGQIVALDLEGRLAWARHLGLEISPFRTAWGHGSSPVPYRDTLILLCDHEPRSYLLALDRRTGKERWLADRGRGRVSHSTPLVIRGPEGDELIVNSSPRIDAYDPATGKLLWYTGSERQTPIPTAVFQDGVIYLSRGYRNSDYLAIRAGGQGDVGGSHVLWRTPSGASYVPSIVLYEGLLYMTNEIGVVTCADARTGTLVWRRRLGGVFFASPVAGDGKIYMVSETGTTFVLRVGREAEVLAENDLGERFLASPAVSGGRLYLRSDGTLFSVK
ncbi:MAG TPA: PQQ-binding-like beta-propeller repeat protein [Bryobacteraceae bacterium]|nr:PQQ-binding-like beta-propeller repeat protein [Bryobacteraceae bacterium]